MLTAQRLPGAGGLETFRRLARRQGYRVALAHALTTAQTPGGRLHMDAWQWVIGPDAGLFRACREAIAQNREDLLTEWGRPWTHSSRIGGSRIASTGRASMLYSPVPERSAVSVGTRSPRER
jgi:hypothetical protein